MKNSAKSIVLFLFAAGIFASCSPAPETHAKAELSVSDAWALEVPETQTMSAGFLKITNGTGENDSLIGATSDISETTELHEMVMEDETMKMRKIERIDIPAGETIELKRGGLHLMFIDLKKIPQDGETINIELEFEKAGKMKVAAPVKKDMSSEMKSHEGH